MPKSGNYLFYWNDLGDLGLGRPNLGPFTSVLAYRLLEFTFKDVLSHELGLEKPQRYLSRLASSLAGNSASTS